MSPRHGMRMSCPHPVLLRIVDLTTTPSAIEQGWLSEREHIRAARFHQARDRDRYRAAHVAVRRVIGDAAGLDPGGMRFDVGTHGKPALQGTPGVHFSMSMTGDVLLVGVSLSAAIGVDIERVRAIADADALAEVHFTGEERRALADATPGGARDRMFLQGWTRKEACVKMTGLGLSLYTAGFASGMTGGGDVVRMPVGDRVLTVSLADVPLGCDLVGACAVLAEAGQ